MNIRLREVDDSCTDNFDQNVAFGPRAEFASVASQPGSHPALGISGPKDRIEVFIKANTDHFAEDHDRDPVYMPLLQWHIDRVERDYSDLKLTVTSEMMV
ncbi:MAG: hypothetical protein KDK03_16975 [Rhodobacteraceae bacterium]|nr:hypothetical protein [Paracoccaceae bacterium]